MVGLVKRIKQIAAVQLSASANKTKGAFYNFRHFHIKEA